MRGGILADEMGMGKTLQAREREEGRERERERKRKRESKKRESKKRERERVREIIRMPCLQRPLACDCA